MRRIWRSVASLLPPSHTRLIFIIELSVLGMVPDHSFRSLRRVTLAVASWSLTRPMRPIRGHLLRLLLQACDCGDEGGSARNEATCTELTKPLSLQRSWFQTLLRGT